MTKNIDWHRTHTCGLGRCRSPHAITTTDAVAHHVYRSFAPRVSSTQDTTTPPLFLVQNLPYATAEQTFFIALY